MLDFLLQISAVMICFKHIILIIPAMFEKRQIGVKVISAA